MSGSSRGIQQASLHDPDAQTDLEPTSEWKALYGPDSKNTNVAKDALAKSTQSGAGSKKPESGGKKCVRLPSTPYNYD
jgi:hypothetical protein